MKLIHKRALCLLLSAALVFTLLPVNALALNLKNGVTYLDSNGSRLSENHVETIDSGFTELSDGWYMVDSGDVTIDHTLAVNGDAKLILADGASLTVSASSGASAGIEVDSGYSLCIYAQSIGSTMGKLTATGSGNGAGIGSNSSSPSGSITICGGRITATGGSGDGAAAGIGNVYNSGKSFGTISISGGFITATNGSGHGYPDIGGCPGDDDKIFIRGGSIVSNWPDNGIDLDLPYASPYTPPQITIDGGSINLPARVSDPLCNSAGKALSCVLLAVPGQTNATVSSIRIGGESYGNSVYTDGNGFLYLFLPKHDSPVPLVVTMEDGSKYWAPYPFGNSFHAQNIELLSTDKNPIAIENSNPNFNVFSPADITVYKYDPNQTFSAIRNGDTPLTKDQDYTVNGNIITIKSEYLSLLPVGVTTLTFSGLGNGNAALPLTVLGPGEYMALGDSIAAGYGLADYDGESASPPADAYASLVGQSLRMTTCSMAVSGMESSILSQELASSQATAYLTKAKVITLSIGSGDLLKEFLNIVSDKLGDLPDDEVLDRLTALKNDPAALTAFLSALNADDGTGLKNNADLNNAASGFSQNFQSIISELKTAAPNAKIYVTNAYNPYEGIKIPYSAGTLDLGGIADGYIQTLNRAFSASSPDYTLIDTHSAFSQSLQSGTSLVNADLATFNFDPHPNTAGHQKIADMILAACSGGSGQAPTIQTKSLPDGMVLQPYHQVVKATGSTPITWFIVDSLPEGLNLSSTGEISGTPTKSGTYVFHLTAMNAAGSGNCQIYTLQIDPFTGGGTSLDKVINGLSQLSSGASPSTVSGVASGVLSLPSSDQSQLTPQQVAALEGLMQNTLHVEAPAIPAPDTSRFSGPAAMPATAPTVTGLTLATCGATGATLTTTQVPPPFRHPGREGCI